MTRMFIAAILTAICLPPTAARAQGSLNCRYVGCWPFGPNQAVAVDPARNLCFAGAGGGVFVLDVSNPSSPQVRSQDIYGLGVIVRLDYDETTRRLFLACAAGGLDIWNVADPANPSRLGGIVFGDGTYDVCVRGDYAYVAARTEGIIVVDVSDPANPQRVGSNRLSSLAWGLDVAGDYACVAADRDGIYVVDISDPADPVTVGRNDGEARGVMMSGNYAYVGAWSDGLRVVDISNPANPVTVGSVDPGGSFSNSILVDDTLLYFTTGAVMVLNVADPANPDSVGKFSDSYVTDIAWDGHIYSANRYDGMVTWDITNRTAPESLNCFACPSLSRGIAVQGRYAYLCNDANGLYVLDLLDPAHPEPVAHFDPAGQVYDVALGDDHAYVCEYWNGLTVLDVSDPRSPDSVGHVSTNDHALEAVLQGNYVYVADDEDGLFIADVSNPAAPQEAGSYQTRADARHIAVQGNYAYVATDRDTVGIVVVDVSNPAQPDSVGSYRFAGGSAPAGLIANGNVLYVAVPRTFDGLVYALDITDPAHPSRLSSVTIPGPTIKLALVDHYLYVTRGEEGIGIVDIADPDSLELVGWFELPPSALAVAGQRYYIYVANSSLGLWVLANDLIGIEEETGPDDIRGIRIANPVRGDVIRFRTPGTVRAEARLYDCAGVLRRTARSSSGELAIPVRELPSGTYLLRVESGATATTAKVVLER
ncbi:T9SS type A sorting domain-containing protein [candidate division WOR-3 bacterium]|nr:T9SS type A sorting domain-containing protein [candidate division WOR-3 bacterium]